MMKINKNLLLICACVMILFPGSIAFSAQNGTEAEKIFKKTEAVMYPENFYSRMLIKTSEPGKADKTMELENFHKKDVGSFMKILAPGRSRGIRFLQKDQTLWMYNPKAGSRNPVRLSPKASFQGTIFSNNDVSDPDFTDNYDISFLEKQVYQHPELGRIECYVLQGTAKNKDTPYGKVVMWVTTKEYYPVKMEYYAKSGILFKEMTFSAYKTIAGMIRPTVMTMRALDRKELISVVELTELEVRDDLPVTMFTESALTR